MEREAQHRFWGCELIQEGGILLRLPQVAMVTGQTILQRFLNKDNNRLVEFDAFRVAMASLFLSAKIEETPKQIADVLNVFYHIYQKRTNQQQTAPLDPQSQLYNTWRQWLISVERQILIDLGFSIYNLMEEHPHKFILYYIKLLNCSSHQIPQQAWNYLNDSLRTDLCLRFSPEKIACSAIYLATRAQQFPLPSKWHRIFTVSKGDLLEISNEILALYQGNSIPQWLPALTEFDPFVSATEQTPITANDSGSDEKKAQLTTDATTNAQQQLLSSQQEKQPEATITPSAARSTSPNSRKAKQQIYKSSGAATLCSKRIRSRSRSNAREKCKERISGKSRGRSKDRSRERGKDRHRSRSRGREANNKSRRVVRIRSRSNERRKVTSQLRR